MNTLTPEKVKLYNDYTEWLNGDLNFEDRSVGIYWTSELDKELVDEIIENSKSKLIYWDKETLVMKDSGYYVTIKLINIGDESKWIVAGIE